MKMRAIIDLGLNGGDVTVFTSEGQLSDEPCDLGCEDSPTKMVYAFQPGTTGVDGIVCCLDCLVESEDLVSLVVTP